MSKVHKESNKKIKMTAILLHCPPAEAFLQIKREDRIGAKK